MGAPNFISKIDGGNGRISTLPDPPLPTEEALNLTELTDGVMPRFYSNFLNLALDFTAMQNKINVFLTLSNSI